MRPPTAASLLFANIFLAAAWHTAPIIKLHPWHILVGYMQKSTSLFLASEEECSATPKIPSISADGAANRITVMRRPKKGDIVTFTLHKFEPTKNHEIEHVFDTSGTLRLIMHSGGYIPQLHDLLASMSPGETIKSATIDAGYGPYREDLKIRIPTAQVGDVDTSLVKIGTKLAFGEVECSITSMNDEEWICDANHILAGMEYNVDITLESIEPGIQEWGFLEKEKEDANGGYAVATFALGCFWGGG